MTKIGGGHPSQAALHEFFAKVYADPEWFPGKHNGKKRGEILVASDADDDTIRALALAIENVQKSLGGREPKKVIVVPGRLVNIVG